MKFLFDFFPIVLFFVAYKLGNIYIATLSAIAASLIQVLWLRRKTGRFEKISLITFISITLLGGATLFFQNEIFIKWKPTVVYWALGLCFLFSHWIGHKPLLQRIAEGNIQLPPSIWIRLNWSWAIFFALMGVLNLYVVQHYDTDTWVNFKLFGTLGLTFIFVILQGFYMVRYHLPGENKS